MKINQLKQIAEDDSLPPELRNAATVQLRALGEVLPEPEPQPPEPPKPKTHVGIFDQYIGDNKAAELERIALLDSTQKTCGECYLTSTIEAESCALCHKVPGSWLLPSKLDSEQSMFSRMAGGHSAEQIRTALRSPWSSAPGREQFARKLLPLREAAERQEQRQAEGTITSKAAEEEMPVLVSAESVKAAIRYYDLELEKLKETK